MPLGVVTLRRSDCNDDVELKVGSTLAACKQKAARHWNWPLQRIVLRDLESKLMTDGGLVMRAECLIAASLRPYGVMMPLCTCGSTTASVTDSDANTELRFDVPGSGTTTVWSFKDMLSKRIGISHSAFMLHSLPGGDELFPEDDEIPLMAQSSESDEVDDSKVQLDDEMQELALAG